MSERGFSIEQLLAMEPSSTVLTRRGLNVIQNVTTSSGISHGVARSDISQFADGKFQVVRYWAILEGTGTMMHSFLRLHTLQNGELHAVPTPIAITE